MKNAEKVVLSGIRATGKLHLGNYLGALKRFAEMSKNPTFKCFFFVADMHTLTTLKEAQEIKTHLPQIVIDYLAAGVDPNRAAIYVQSSVPQVTELAWYLMCLTPVGDLERLPTFKDKRAKQMEDVNAGLLGYPVLMAADILGPRADFVPVGRDQKPHLEMAADLARRFNRLYGSLFSVPDPMEQEMVLIPGLSLMDERGGFAKMGKSDGNTINLSDSEKDTWEKIRTAPTDPQRIRREDRGDPEKCAIYALHQCVSRPETLNWAREGCSTAGIGCIECKRSLSSRVNELLAEFREARQEILRRPEVIREVLASGATQAAYRFNETIREVRERMGICEWR